MAKKKKVEEEDSDDEVFHVEVITKARVGEDGDWEYLVKWAGYNSDADSWEPADNVKQCDRLLGSFWRHVGTDDNDYPIGYELSARDEWINKEKKFFAETFTKPTQKRTEKGSKKKSEKRKASVPASSSDDAHSDSSDDIALAKSIVKKRKVVQSKSDATPGASTSRPVSVPQPKTNPVQSSSLKFLSFKKSKPSAPTIQFKDYTKQSDAGTSASTVQFKHYTKQPDAGTSPSTIQSKDYTRQPDAGTSASIIQSKDSTRQPDTGPSAPIIQTKDHTRQPGGTVPPLPNDTVAEKAGFTENSFEPFPEAEEMNFEPLTAHLPEKPMEEIMAEQFLKTVNITALNTPVEPEVTATADIQRAVAVSKPTPSRIPKKWKWSGDLFITCTDTTELLCNVTIKDPPGLTDSSVVSLLMSQTNSLQISKLYLTTELPPILRSCTKPQYFAMLESTESHDEVLIQGLRQHMIIQQQTAIIPLLLDDVEVAVLVIFPTFFAGLIKFLKIPQDRIPDNSLLVVLLPFYISPCSAVKVGERAVCDVQGLHPRIGKSHSLHKKPIVYQAILFLGFPSSLLELLDNPSRTYGIWFSSSDCGQSTSGLETALLQLILGATRATVSNLKDEVRFVFIHVGALPTIRTLPSLVAKLSEHPETHFYTYGTHSSVETQRWGIREIFPLGGIVTFTATALAEDPVGCYRMMTKIAEHPVWECFITPNVLAASNILAMDNNSPSPYLEPILELIDTGQVSLIRLPGFDMASKLQWLSSFIQEHTLSGSERLEACTAYLKTQMETSGVTVTQLPSMINDELIKDMAKVQLQPDIMDHHRRFVIARAASEASIPADKDGFEWCSLASFDFKDDFFE